MRVKEVLEYFTIFLQYLGSTKEKARYCLASLVLSDLEVILLVRTRLATKLSDSNTCVFCLQNLRSTCKSSTELLKCEMDFFVKSIQDCPFSNI